MISVFGRGSRMCDGLTRRELMRIGGLSLFGGMTLPALLRASATSPKSAPGRTGVGNGGSLHEA